MSSETTEQIGDEILNSYSSNPNSITTINNYENFMNNHSSVNFNDLINRIISIVNERLDDAQQCKTMFQKDSMQPAFYQVLREMKDKIGKTAKKKKKKKKKGDISIAFSTE
jgi:thiaminase